METSTDSFDINKKKRIEPKFLEAMREDLMKNFFGELLNPRKIEGIIS
jgi:hypothetical protein